MATLKRSIRILDTRAQGGKLKANETRRIGIIAPPAEWARAAIIDLGVAETEAPGWIVAWSGEGDKPGVSNQDYPAGATYSNLVHVPISKAADGGWGFSVYALTACHLTAELQGWDSVI